MITPARRTFFKAAGAGAVVAGTVAVTSRGAEAAPSTALPDDAYQHEILAHVKDARTGRITVMVEGHEVEIVDHALVAKLANAVSERG